MYVCTCIYIHNYVWIQVCSCCGMQCTCTCKYVLFVCTYIYMYRHIVFVHVHVHIRTYVCGFRYVPAVVCNLYTCTCTVSMFYLYVLIYMYVYRHIVFVYRHIVFVRIYVCMWTFRYVPAVVLHVDHLVRSVLMQLKMTFTTPLATATDPQSQQQVLYHILCIAGYFWGVYISRISWNENFPEDCTEK